MCTLHSSLQSMADLDKSLGAQKPCEYLKMCHYTMGTTAQTYNVTNLRGCPGGLSQALKNYLGCAITILCILVCIVHFVPSASLVSKREKEFLDFFFTLLLFSEYQGNSPSAFQVADCMEGTKEN